MGLGDSFKILFLFTFLFLNFVAAQTVPRLSSVAEWRALMELRSSLGIRAIDWHKKANPCLNWTGIRCNNGHITRINLSGLRRNPEAKLNPRFAVDALPNFSSLSVFNSSGFSLGGSIPEWLGRRLSNLTVLDLSSSSIDGPIPSSFGSLSRLSSLCLSNNSLAGIIPTELGNLSALSVLDLSQNSLTGQIPNKISVLGNLSKLDLSSNFLSGPIPVGFSSLSSLKLLNLSKNSLSASIPAQLGNLTQLSELDLRYNSFSGSLPNELGGLRSLRKMMVGNNVLEGSLPDALFQELNRLEYLVLNGNNFVGRLPNAIWSMASLNYLDFSQNNLTGVFPSHVSSFNVTDAVFNFSYNLFYGNLSSTIRNFRIIDLSSNYFEGSAPTYTRGSIILSNNCFSNVPNQRNSVACQEFYSERATPSGDNPIQPRKSRNKLVYVMIGTFGGLGLIIVVIAAISLLLRTCNIGSTNQERGNSRTEPPPRVLANLSSMGQLFTHEQIKLATSNFSNENLIKHGHSGDLFRGTLEGGQIVIVKKVNMNSSRKESFMCELDMFGKVSHPRLVPLVGHCLDDENEKMLVYKYMPNGDLSNSLYRLANGEEEEEQMQSLDWITRLKIAIGAAEVLSYLHQECTPPIVHRDIQASSILLDDKYEVRLGSLSEVRAAGANNHHNMISRLLTPQTSRKRPSGKSSVSCAYDVYCFGKVLLELVTGRLGISSSSNEADAKQWLDTNLQFITIHNKELMIKIVDQSLIIDEDLLEEIWAVAIVARSCLNPKASRRPSMMHVLKALENPFKVVRDEKFNSDRLRTVSSIQSWTNVFFGSWHRSSSGSSSVSGPTSREIIGGARQVGSRSSGANDHSSSHKRSSSDVFPEPKDMQDLERQMDTT